MTGIRVLDTDTANRIAAGEVVERPASIVKEVVENSIDSGASRIEVEITSGRGAIQKIRVTDDGMGMSPADMELVFTRHSTSKIRSIGDLLSCATLGFRGEALASIASVARVTIISRQRGPADMNGTHVICAGGEIIEKKETGCPFGTTVTVEDIFFNTPVRKNFQKSLKTELGYISAMMERIILSSPHVSFRFIHNGKEKFATSAGGDLLSVIAALFGNDVKRNLIRVEGRGSHVGLDGYISRPSLSRQSPYQIFLSINGRIVYSRGLIEAIKEGYGTVLPSDSFPVVFLDLSIERDLVDVNVHPAKRHVRISHEEDVRADVRKIIHDTLRSQNLVPGIREELDLEKSARTAYSPSAGSSWGVKEPSVGAMQATDRRLRQTALFSGEKDHPLQIFEMQVIGQLGDTYILASTPDEDLVIIDQHAAHERILYDQISERKDPHLSQELIAPVTIHLSHGETQFLVEKLDALSKEGFHIEEFGTGTFLVRAVPVFLGRCEDPDQLREFIAGMLDEGIRTAVDGREKIRRLVACRGAIKAGTICTADQCARLASQLLATKDPWTCPHGRPTMILLPKKKIDTLFKRL